MNSKLETILFISAKSVSFEKMAEILDTNKDKIIESIKQLQKEYNENQRGFRIVANEKEAEIVSAPENKEIVDKIIKSEIQSELSQAALEALSVIMYKGPVSRSEIEEIRGVNCGIILRNLTMRGLVEKMGKGDNVKYRATIDLFKKLGMEDDKNFKFKIPNNK